jgi:hypothetical protein
MLGEHQDDHSWLFRALAFMNGRRVCNDTVYSRRTKLTTVAQSCGYPVDGQMDCLHHALVGIARPVTSQQFDLYMVERIEVRCRPGETLP